MRCFARPHSANQFLTFICTGSELIAKFQIHIIIKCIHTTNRKGFSSPIQRLLNSFRFTEYRKKTCKNRSTHILNCNYYSFSFFYFESEDTPSASRIITKWFNSNNYTNIQALVWNLSHTYWYRTYHNIISFN